MNKNYFASDTYNEQIGRLFFVFHELLRNPQDPQRELHYADFEIHNAVSFVKPGLESEFYFWLLYHLDEGISNLVECDDPFALDTTQLPSSTMFNPDDRYNNEHQVIVDIVLYLLVEAGMFGAVELNNTDENLRATLLTLFQNSLKSIEQIKTHNTALAKAVVDYIQSRVELPWFNPVRNQCNDSRGITYNQTRFYSDKFRIMYPYTGPGYFNKDTFYNVDISDVDMIKNSIIVNPEINVMVIDKLIQTCDNLLCDPHDTQRELKMSDFDVHKIIALIKPGYELDFYFHAMLHIGELFNLDKLVAGESVGTKPIFRDENPEIGMIDTFLYAFLQIAIPVNCYEFLTLNNDPGFRTSLLKQLFVDPKNSAITKMFGRHAEKSILDYHEKRPTLYHNGGNLPLTYNHSTWAVT